MSRPGQLSMFLLCLAASCQTFVLGEEQPEAIVQNSIGMKLAYIPAGGYIRGFKKAETIHDDDNPQHAVRISKPFRLGITEVTQKQWQMVMNTSPWQREKVSKLQNGDDVAASHVSWDDAVAFCAALSKKEMKEYRLPTEAEWEYACRAGTKTAFSFGDDASRLRDYAWCYENSIDVNQDYPHRVAQKKPNPWGLYDMHGNVWEWCATWWDYKEYKQLEGTEAVDPMGPARGLERVMRGGCFITTGDSQRCATRLRERPRASTFAIGFRVVQVIETR